MQSEKMGNELLETELIYIGSTPKYVFEKLTLIFNYRRFLLQKLFFVMTFATLSLWSLPTEKQFMGISMGF